MSIKLTWLDRNVTVDNFRIYRSSSVIVDGALPAVLATVPAGTYSYTDTTALRNTVYHYRVSAVTGADEILSSDMALANMPNVGPGPQALLRGDWNCGYFGRMPIENLFSQAEMRALCGFSGAGQNENPSYWLKFVYQGKILYFPEASLVTGIAWLSIYQAGLVYGNIPSANWAAGVKSSYGTIPQNFQISNGVDSFIVRLPQVRSSITATATDTPSLITGEVDLCFASCFQNRTLLAANPTLPANVDDLISSSITFMCMDTYTAGSDIVRGGNGFDPIQSNPYANTGTAIGTTWRPVLELIF